MTFAEIVESTELVARLGDESWVALWTSFYALVGSELSKFQGWYLSAAGDGFLAAFDECSLAILRRVQPCYSMFGGDQGGGALGLRVRIGVHAGECVDLGGFLTGLTVHIRALIAAVAAADEMLVSDFVKAQFEQHEIQFIDRGTYRLKGVPGVSRLFATCQT